MNAVVSFPMTAAFGLAMGAVIAWGLAGSVDVGERLPDVSGDRPVTGVRQTTNANTASASPDAILQCDLAATHPDDPNGVEKGVDDGDVPRGRAIQSCTEAVAAAPTEPRLHFQLGRALWLAGRHEEAVQSFADAAEIGYAPAEMYIGHAYVEGRGLPPDDVKSIHTALSWYERSAANGFLPAEDAVLEAKAYIRRNDFNASEFQEPDYITRLHDGDFENMPDPILFFSYTEGMFKMLDSEQAMDHAPECKPILNRLGQIKINIGKVTSYIDTAVGSENFLEGLFKIGGGVVLGGLASDAGERDAVKMINIHGCDSKVSRAIVNNLIGLETVIEAHLSRAGQVVQ